MSVASRREREREERRHQILAAAEKVFFSKGFAAATMDEVAAEAELSKGTLYLYFKNKDDLFVALAEPVLGELARRLEAVAAADEAGLECLRAMLCSFAEVVLANPDHFRIAASWMGSGMARADFAMPSFVGHRALVLRNVTCLVQAIERGQADGSVRGDVAPMPTAARVWAGLFGVVIWRLNAGRAKENRLLHFELGEFVPGFVDLLCDGLRAKPDDVKGSASP